MNTPAIDYYRDWQIQIERGQAWTATIATPDGSADICIEGENETELFAAAVEHIDRQIIDRNAPEVSPED